LGGTYTIRIQASDLSGNVLVATDTVRHITIATPHPLASFCLETHPALYLQGFDEHIGDWN
jgi:hypothetical protein